MTIEKWLIIYFAVVSTLNLIAVMWQEKQRRETRRAMFGSEEVEDETLPS